MISMTVNLHSFDCKHRLLAAAATIGEEEICIPE